MAEIPLMQENESRNCNPCYISRIGGDSADNQHLAASLMVHYRSTDGNQGATLSSNHDMGPTIAMAGRMAFGEAKADDIYTRVMDPAHRTEFEKNVQAEINKMLPNNKLEVDKVELTSITFSNAFVAEEKLKEKSGTDLTDAQEHAKSAFSGFMKSLKGDGQ